MLTFRLRTFLAILGFATFTLLFLAFGIRWHINRATAAGYARQEVEHTFEAAHYSRAARSLGDSDDSQSEAAGYRNLARMHAKAARECTQLRELYENAW